MNIPTELQSIMSMKPLIIGIGNELRGDDAAGIEIVGAIHERGYHNSIIVYGTPENYLQKIARMPGDVRLWVDIINWQGKPGEIKILNTEQIIHHSISTHNFSPIVLVEYLRAMKDIPDFFLGIQPQNLSLGSPISDKVGETIEKLVEYICDHLGT
jgi:hydrogenase 3 maturation protease